jgi:hypothetical protein
MPTSGSGGNQRSVNVTVVDETTFTVFSEQGESGNQDSDFSFAVFGDL